MPLPVCKNVDLPVSLYPSANGTAGYYFSNAYICYPTVSLRTVTEDDNFNVTARNMVYLVGRLKTADSSRFRAQAG